MRGVSNMRRLAVAVLVACLGFAVTIRAQSSIYVFGVYVLHAVSGYINFGSVAGTNGYGFRDNAGTMEKKDSGGSWAAIAGAGGPGVFSYIAVGSTPATTGAVRLTHDTCVTERNTANMLDLTLVCADTDRVYLGDATSGTTGIRAGSDIYILAGNALGWDFQDANLLPYNNAISDIGDGTHNLRNVYAGNFVWAGGSLKLYDNTAVSPTIVPFSLSPSMALTGASQSGSYAVFAEALDMAGHTQGALLGLESILDLTMSGTTTTGGIINHETQLILEDGTANATGYTMGALALQSQLAVNGGTLHKNVGASQHLLYVTGGTFSGFTTVTETQTYINGVGAGAVPLSSDVWIASPIVDNSSQITARQAIRIQDQTGSSIASTCSPFWYDSPGVLWADCAGVFEYHNPAFTKYTPAIANEEYGIFGRWTTNVYEVGTAAGGTGVLRTLRLLGASVEAQDGASNYVGIKALTFNATSAYQLNGVSVASPILCSNTAASTAITGNTKTYASLNCKVAASTLTAGKTIAFNARGVYGGNVTDTLVMTLEACQVSGCASGTKVTLATTGALSLLAVSNQGWEMDEHINAFTIGGSGTLDTQGKAFYETAATTAVIDWTPNTSTATVDTTVDEYLSVSVTFSTASASDSLTLRNLQVVIQ